MSDDRWNKLDATEDGVRPLLREPPRRHASPSALSDALQYAAEEMLDLGSEIRSSLVQHLKQSPTPLDAVVVISPQLELLLKLDRQVDRFANVLTRIREGEAKKASSDTYDAEPSTNRLQQLTPAERAVDDAVELRPLQPR